MKDGFDKWFVIDSDLGKTYILYDDISAFTINSKKKSLQIFLRGATTPFVFNFDNTESLQAAYDEICRNLSKRK